MEYLGFIEGDWLLGLVVFLLFYDPPYSLRQVAECYKSVGIEVTMETTQSSWRPALS